MMVSHRGQSEPWTRCHSSVFKSQRSRDHPVSGSDLNKRPYENYQHESFKGRVELRDPSMKDGDVSVIVRNVSIRDTGTYECLITSSSIRGGERVISEFKHSINLTVKDSGPTHGGDKAGGDKAGGHKAGGHKAGGHKAGGHKAGGHKGGGDKGGGDKDGEDKDGSLSLIAGLSVGAVLVVVVVVIKCREESRVY